MSEKLQVQKNSSAPSQMAPSPQFQQWPFTDERYHPVASTETVTANSPPNIARASFNLMNIPIFAPSPAAALTTGAGGVQLKGSEQEKEKEDSQENVLETIWRGLMGEFNENPSLGSIGVDFFTSIIPGVDQVADVRDLIAHKLLKVRIKKYYELLDFSK